MTTTRTTFLEAIELMMTFDHQFKMPASAQIHDSIPRPERVRISVTLHWHDEAIVADEASIDAVVNYAPVYFYLMRLAERPEKGLIESILDEICNIGFQDRRVDRVEARIARLDISASGAVGASITKDR